MSADSLVAVVLAAGRATRMGRPKALLPIGGRAVIEHVIDTLLHAEMKEIRVVVGHARERISPLIKANGARIVVNAQYDQGMFSSVQAGLRELPAGTAGVLILPVDIALVRPWTVRYLARRFCESPDHIVYPEFNGRRGHPPIIPLNRVPQIHSFQAPGGLRACLETSAGAALDVPVPDRHVLFDMDTPADYEALLQRAQRWMIPDADECGVILEQIYRVAPEVAAHGRAVSRSAVSLARALVAAGEPLDAEALRAAALLHDLAKGRPAHARTGAEWLRAMGFTRVAEIVAAHTDPPAPGPRLCEEELLFLADKYLEGEQQVSLDERFAKARARFGGDPEALHNIEARFAAARAIAQRIRERLGHKK